MTTYSIASFADLVTNAPYASGDVANLTASFAADTGTVVQLTGGTVEGNGFTISFPVGRSVPLFSKCTGGTTIRNLVVDANSQYTTDAYLITSDASVYDYVVSGVRLDNAALGSISAGFHKTATAANYILYVNCTANLNPFVGGVGGMMNASNKANFIRCECNFTSMFSNTGGLIRTINGDSIIDCCKVSTVNAQGISGGLYNVQAAGNVYVSRCYTNFTNPGSYRVGGFFTTISSGTAVFTDCYTNVTSLGTFNRGGAFGLYNYATATFSRCYAAVSDTDNFTPLIAQAGTFTINHCHFPDPNNSTGTITNNGSVFGSLAAITGTLPPQWSAFTWNTPTAGQLPTLKCIEDGIGFGNSPPPCFLAGTMVMTVDGEKDISKIAESDVLVTKNGNKKILGMSITCIENSDMESNPQKKPVCLRSKTVGDFPVRDTWMSRFHKISIGERMVDCNTLFIEGDELCFKITDTYYSSPEAILSTVGQKELVYYNLLVEDGETYIANGLVVESYTPDVE